MDQVTKDRTPETPNRKKSFVNDKDFPQKYCIYTLRRFDFENFYNTKFIDEEMPRRTAFAVRAFNVEISQIRDVTTVDHIAKMRFQFWLDAIDNVLMVDGDSKDHPSPNQQPILHEIKMCNQACGGKLSKQWFKRLIDARNSPVALSNFPFNTMKELETYCDSSVSPVFYMINEAMIFHLGGSSKPDLQLKLHHIGSHVGKAQGLANVIRGIVHNAQHKRCYVPSELLLKHNVSHQDLLRVNELPSQQVRDVYFDIASLSHQHLMKAKNLCQDNSLKNYRSAFLPIITIERFLDRLRKNDFNIVKTKCGRQDLFFPISLYFRSRLWRLGRI